jgi:spermidine synthase
MSAHIESKWRYMLFIAFFITGYCGLLYQTIWLRLAFAKFGVITPVVSVVIFVFMLGLGLGAASGGKLVPIFKNRTKLGALFFYAVLELIVGTGAFLVPSFFDVGSHLLLGPGAFNSFNYLFLSGLIMTISVLPFSYAMGLSFPVAMAYVLEITDGEVESFSFLYFANVLGAVLGVLSTAVVLVECLGFQGTLFVGAGIDFLLGGFCLLLAWSKQNASKVQRRGPDSAIEASSQRGVSPFAVCTLFTTGFVSMALEVVWTRSFNSILGTEVYSFASLVASYLIATALGTYYYRLDTRRKKIWSNEAILVLSSFLVFLPVLLNDPRLLLPWNTHAEVRSILALLSIMPFCIALGYLTPKLVDQEGQGKPATAGRAYAINIIGSMMGPITAGYFLLPCLGAKWGEILLAVPILILLAWQWRQALALKSKLTIAIGLVFLAACFCDSYEDGGALASESRLVRRDCTATVISFGAGRAKQLCVNGQPITALVLPCKLMAHLPLLVHEQSPQSALLIGFGMGTTLRSLSSWGLDTTVVELSPSVVDAFSYYYESGPDLLKSPKVHVVIDDARRFLKRTKERYDVIVVDPPPPVETAGSSLLYSVEFYRQVKEHLKPGGILQQWFPDCGNRRVLSAVAKSLVTAFPFVVSCRAQIGLGRHFLASDQALETFTADQLMARLPPTALADLEEKYCQLPLNANLKLQFQTLVASNRNASQLLDPHNKNEITDDRPFNEYYALRKYGLIMPVQ